MSGAANRGVSGERCLTAGSGQRGHSVRAVNKRFLQFQNAACVILWMLSQALVLLWQWLFVKQKDGSSRGNSTILESGKPSHGYVCRERIVVLLIWLHFQSCSAFCPRCRLSDVSACESSSAPVLCPKSTFSCGHSKAEGLVLFTAEQLEGYRKQQESRVDLIFIVLGFASSPWNFFIQEFVFELHENVPS